MDVFLSQKEKSQVQRMYQKWLEHVSPEAICDSLYTEGILSDREKQEYDAKATKYGRAEMLFSSCLIRATYPQIEKIRQILNDADQEYLAAMLPMRSSDPYGRQGGPTPPFGPAANSDRFHYRGPPPQQDRPYQPPQQNIPHQPPQQGYRSQFQPQPGPTFRQQAQPRPAPGPTPTNVPRAQGPPQGIRPVQETIIPNIRPTAPGVSESRARQPAPTSSDTRPVQGQSSRQQFGPSAPQPSPFSQQPNHQQRRGDNSTQQHPSQQINQNNRPNARPTGTLPVYPTRDLSAVGKGYCLIVANFTAKYRGYENDIAEIENFFANTLRYHVKKYTDMRVTQMKQLLERTVRELNGNQMYDRFILFVLSEGNDEEICGSHPMGDGPDLGQESGCVSLEKLKMEDVVNMFTHEDNCLPMLRCLPKVFFFQNCVDVPVPGSDALTHPAGGPQSPAYEALAQSAANADKVTVGADIFVCKAEQPGYLMGNNPSWMIQHLIDIFKKHYRYEHLVDMVTQLNFELARRVAVEGEQNHLLKVTHNLTEKFYFFNAKMPEQV